MEFGIETECKECTTMGDGRETWFCTELHTGIDLKASIVLVVSQVSQVYVKRSWKQKIKSDIQNQIWIELGMCVSAEG